LELNLYNYSAYGLAIRSDLALPEFITSEERAEAQIRIVGLEHIPLDARGEQPYLRLNHDEAVLSLSGVGTFVVRGGREILVIPDSTVDERLVRRYIVGNIMAMLLYQRGMLVLHASTVANAEGAISFIGSPGYGKSTIATALTRRDYGFVADDVTAVRLGYNTPMATPGYPQIKISFETAEVLGINKAALTQLDAAEEKQGYHLDSGFLANPQPMQCIYILSNKYGLQIEPISPQIAVLELIRHSLPTRWVRPDDVDHFQKCVTLATKVPFFHLRRSDSLEELPEMVKLVKKHISNI
jgi:hypothetical protein